MNKELTPAERRELDAALCGDGQRLKGNAIVQTHDGPMMLPCEPRIVVADIGLSTPDIEDADIPY